MAIIWSCIRALNFPHENVPGPFDGEKRGSRLKPVTKRCAVVVDLLYGMLSIVARNVAAVTSEQSLRRLVETIVANDCVFFSKLIAGSSALATASFSHGATRQGPRPSPCFIEEIGHYIYSGDTALHFAAASYRHDMAEKLIKAGANVRARNRRGAEPLHAAAFGSPGSPRWDPAAQASTIVCLIEAGADPNAQNMDGATPLHRAVRTRCGGRRTCSPRLRRESGEAQQKRFDGHAFGLAYYWPRRVRLTGGEGSTTGDSVVTPGHRRVIDARYGLRRES
jgi:hypothetical protein